jgi:hypothetical protein
VAEHGFAALLRVHVGKERIDSIEERGTVLHLGGYILVPGEIERTVLVSCCHDNLPSPSLNNAKTSSIRFRLMRSPR